MVFWRKTDGRTYDEDSRGVFVSYLERFIGLPYLWGGDDPMAGFDCSGLVVEGLKAVGIVSNASDWTAHDLFTLFVSKIVTEPSRGCLVFFGKDGTVRHVGVCVDGRRMIESGGGGSRTQTLQDAMSQNAFVRVRPINMRGDLVAIADPFWVKT